jgi:uncharacterized protein (TIGR03437 family)
MRITTCIAGLLTLPVFAGSYSISTVAGSDWVGENVPATSAIFLQAEGIAMDGVGNIYVSDANNHRVRQIGANGIVHTIAGNGIAGFSGDGGPASAAQLNSPYGLALDSAGNLYIADLGNARIRCITPAGVISTIAGGGALAAGGVNEGSNAALLAFKSPRNIAIDESGVMYISDFGGGRVYKMAVDGTLTTLAGTGAQGYSGDGPAPFEQLNFPAALATDHQGNVYIADSGNHLIRKVSSGQITSIARSAVPTGLAFDGYYTLYVADHSAGQITAIALLTGTATAMNVSATDVTVGPDGNLYVADRTLIRRVTMNGVATVIGGGGSMAEGDGGAATSARLNHPSGAALDAIGNLYIADQANNRIRRVGLDGTITTVAGMGIAGNTGDGGPAMVATLNAPTSVTFDSGGNLYIADTGNARIRMVTPGGVIQPVTAGPLTAPAYMLLDAAHNLYVADSSAIYKTTVAGVTTTVLGGLTSPRGMAFDSSGNFYFSEPSLKQVWMVTPSGAHSQVAAGLWNSPEGLAVDASGDLLVADSGLAKVVSVNSYGQVTPIAGTGTAGFAGDGGAAASAELNAPSDVVLSTSGASNGSIYIADTANGRVRQLVGSSSAQSVAPILVVNAVNAASLAPGPVAPGMLMAITGTGLTSNDVSATQVLFNTTNAPILAITPTQILVRAPVSLVGSSSVTITINNQSVQIAQILASVADAAPALFAGSNGQVSAINQDGTLNSPSNPAPQNSILTLFGTGEGVTGLPFLVSVGGYPCTILYAGPAGAYPGMFQINLQLPGGYFSGGTLPVVVSVGTFTTQSGLTVSVE